MSFTVNELALVNQALGRIGAGNISSAENGSTTCNNYVQANLHYSHTRDALLRSFDWDFAVTQSKLSLISTLTLNVQPLPSSWIVGDTITGLTSGVTAEILTVTSETEYEIIYLSGTFTSGERITNAMIYNVYWEGIPVTWEGEQVVWYDNSDSDEVFCGTGYPVVTSIEPDFHYDYQYQLPDDFDRLTKYHQAHYYWYNRWTIQGKRFLSREGSAEIEYVKKVTDPADFDALFYEVVKLQLALNLLPVLAGTQTTSFAERLDRDFTRAYARARVVCRAETNNTGRSDWNLARFKENRVG
jgi:hypothetical protein